MLQPKKKKFGGALIFALSEDVQRHQPRDEPTSLSAEAGQTLPQTHFQIKDWLARVQPQDGQSAMNLHEILDLRSEALVIVLPGHLGKLFRVSHQCRSRETSTQQLIARRSICQARLSGLKMSGENETPKLPPKMCDEAKTLPFQFRICVPNRADIWKGIGRRKQGQRKPRVRFRRQARREAPTKL